MIGQVNFSSQSPTNCKKTCNKIELFDKDIEDDGKSLTEDASTIFTTSESIQLSLPDNFDDAFSINGVSFPPIKSLNAEGRLLQAQILDLRSHVRYLTEDRECCLKALQSFDTNSTFENQTNIEQIPEEKRSLVQHVSLILKQKLSNHHDELRVAIDKAKISRDIAEQQKEKATNAQIICEQRIVNIQEALDAANERRKESDHKCKSLQDKVVEIEQKGRQFDDLKSKLDTLENDSKRMRAIMDKRQKDIELTKVESETNKAKVKDLSSQIHALEMDKSFMEKEKSLLLQRIQEAENRCKNTECLLREANTRCDDMSLELSNANASAKAESEAKALIEVKRIRSECDEELKRYREQVETSYKREVAILKDTKEDITRQSIEAQNQVVKLREMLEKVSTEKDESIKRLEKSLSDCCSDLKNKCIESSKLHLCNDQLEQNICTLKSEAQMLSSQVEAHRNEFKNLEQECSHQRKQLMDEIERKNEQLEMYYHSQKKAVSLCSQEANNKMLSFASDRVSVHHFLDKAKELEKKNSDLLKAVSHLKKEMKKQNEQNATYQMKVKDSEDEIGSLKKKLKEAAEDKITENGDIMTIKATNKALKEDLHQSRLENRRVSYEYTYLQTKYNQLIDNFQNFQNSCHIQPRTRHQDRNIQVWKVDGTTKVATPIKAKNRLV